MNAMTNTLSTWLMLSLTLIFQSAHAQQFDASTQNMVFALVLTYPAPTLVEKDSAGKPAKDSNGQVIQSLTSENQYAVTTRNSKGDITRIVETKEVGVKMSSTRISNREILLDLVQQGVIPTITGYSIAWVSGAEPTVILRKAGQEPIDVSHLINLKMLDGVAFSSTFQEITNSDYIKNTNSYSQTGTTTGRRLAFITIEGLETRISCHAFFRWSATLQSLINPATNEKYFMYVPNASTIDSIVGNMQLKNQDRESSVIEGKISLSSGVPFTR